MTHNIQDIITGLNAAREKSPDLAAEIDFHIALIQAQSQARLPVVSSLPTAAQVEDALRNGTPLLHLVELNIDPHEVVRLAAEICRIIADHQPDLAESLKPVNRHLGRNGQMKQAIDQYLNGGYPTTPVDDNNSADSSLLTFVLRQTLRPFLQAAVCSLQPLTSNPHPPTAALKSTCPMCGGPPDFAALVSQAQNDEHGRRLLCARCDTEWNYKRSGCPYCETTGRWFYFPDDNEVYRLYVCDACRHYLKTVDWRQTFAHRNLPVERVLTATMDMAAVHIGYLS